MCGSRGGRSFGGMELAIETAGLSKAFGDRLAVDRVDLRVPRGTAFGFLGPNGAGKTTVVRMLLGLTSATAGEMRLLGRPLPAGRRDALARVGAIVEEPRFHDFLSGRRNLEIAAAARGPEAQRRIPAVLDRVGLTARAQERVARYSMGMRQRLGLARCLLADPELLLLDEPTNGLDPAGVLEFRAFVRELVEEGRTVFLSSHVLDEVERICDAVAIIDRGQVLAHGSIEEVAGGHAGELRIGTSEPARAAVLLSGWAGAAAAAADGTTVAVTLHDGGEIAAAAAVRLLVEAGLDVFRVEPATRSLEERFLDVTSRLREVA
jgi:ABC-2 type transport system ATP-binding protein